MLLAPSEMSQDFPGVAFANRGSPLSLSMGDAESLAESVQNAAIRPL